MLRERRSPSQILFNLLPGQTVDLSGRIWRVDSWRDPLRLPVDDHAIRRRLIAALDPWRQAGKDGFAAQQLHERHSLEVVELNRDRGVVVDPFPQVWVCQHCRRIARDTTRACRCGQRRWGQLHFVGYHDCGALFEPWIPPCPQHGEVVVNSPRTAQAKDLVFSCPTCGAETLRGLGVGRPCRECNQPHSKYTVHRAAAVYTSHSLTMVNPARPDQLRELQAAGGSARCLDWVLDGMPGERPDSAPVSRTTLLESLLDKGLPRAAAEAAVAAAAGAGHDFTSDASLDEALPEPALTHAREDALDIAVAVHNGRRSARSLGGEPVRDALGDRYRNDYPPALDRSGLCDVDLVDRFPVLRGVFGYTRDGGTAGGTRLVMFRGRNGSYRVYADSNETEALFVRLDPVRVARWLHDRGHLPVVPDDPRQARLEILRHAPTPHRGAELPTETPGSALLTLLHSYTHRLIRTVAVLAGIDREALAEYLVPDHLGAFVYAGSRGDFVLGGLQAVFEADLHQLLDSQVDNESRCPLDPGCGRGAGACLACLHLGEPSCTYYNRFLGRRALFGHGGYLSTPTR